MYGTFKNCTFVGDETLRWCYTSENKTTVFENCVIKTTKRGIHFDAMDGDVTFKNCEINGFNAYSGKGTMTFEDCTFGIDASNYNGLNIYTNTNIRNCTFNYVSGKTNFIDLEGTGKTLTITNCTATLDGAAANVAVFVGGSMLAKNTVVIDDSVMVKSADVLKAAITNGGNIMLAADITMTESIAKKDANFTLDGNGYTITMAEDATNTNALFDITGGKASIKNITFNGIKEGAVVRTVGVEFTAENVTAENGVHTQKQGLFRLMGKSTIKNCTFKNNTCNLVITLNYDGANNDPQVVENCVFESNTCNQTAVLYYVKGAGATINGNKFVNNTVNVSNGATLYMGFTENNVIINNLFDSNTVTATSKRSSGGLMIGYEAVITGNAFVNNTVTVNGETGYGNDVCASTYYTGIDLTGNYWGGGAPVENDDYYNEYRNNEVSINGYLTVNPFN